MVSYGPVYVGIVCTHMPCLIRYCSLRSKTSHNPAYNLPPTANIAPLGDGFAGCLFLSAWCFLVVFFYDVFYGGCVKGSLCIGCSCVYRAVGCVYWVVGCVFGGFTKHYTRTMPFML